jgi:hypothetical protein
VAAKRSVIGPPSETPSRAARSDPTASITARMSSILVSRSAMPLARSERPVPLLSNRITREKEASRLSVSAAGPSQADSKTDRIQPPTNTMSKGPSPKVE